MARTELAAEPPVRRRDDSPSYLRVLLTFARNSLIRDMTFRTNFLVQCISSLSWTLMNLGFYVIVFRHTTTIGPDSGWGRTEFFVFLATTWIVNSIVQAFFMPNADEFSELIRTGNLDFALLKPIDTQFLISFTRVEWSSLANLAMGIGLLIYGVRELGLDPIRPTWPSPLALLLYPLYLACGIAILYSSMISLAATSIWLGRNQTLYDFWFYITNFYRHPMEIFQRGRVGWALWGTVLPILVVVNVPARLLAKPLRPEGDPWLFGLALLMVVSAGASLWLSRRIFRAALASYRSASS